MLKEKRKYSDKSDEINLAQYIQVSDSEIIEDDSTFFGVKEDLIYKNGGININNISIYREYLKPGVKVRFSVKVQYDKLRKFGINSFNDILSALEFKKNNIVEIQEKTLKRADDEQIWIKYSSTNVEPNAILGGGTGFFSKSVLYNVSCDKKRIFKLVAKHLDIKFIGKNNHHHLKEDVLMSPRAIKLVTYNNEKYVVGMCKIRKV